MGRNKWLGGWGGEKVKNHTLDSVGGKARIFAGFQFVFIEIIYIHLFKLSQHIHGIQLMVYLAKNNLKVIK